MAGPNKTKPALRRAKVKGYDVGKEGSPSKASDDHAAQSRMFSDENEKRKARKSKQSTQISNFEVE